MDARECRNLHEVVTYDSLVEDDLMKPTGWGRLNQEK